MPQYIYPGIDVPKALILFNCFQRKIILCHCQKGCDKYWKLAIFQSYYVAQSNSVLWYLLVVFFVLKCTCGRRATLQWGRESHQVVILWFRGCIVFIRYECSWSEAEEERKFIDNHNICPYVCLTVKWFSSDRHNSLVNLKRVKRCSMVPSKRRMLRNSSEKMCKWLKVQSSKFYFNTFIETKAHKIFVHLSQNLTFTFEA